MATRPLEPASATLSVQALADSAAPRRRLVLCRTLTRRALESYWRAAHPAPRPALPALEMPLPDHEVDDDGRRLAEDIGTAAAALDPVQASYSIGRVYAALLPDRLRATWGAYYTPPVVVDRLLRQAEAAGVDWGTCRALDPACGGGAFLAPLALRMRRALDGCEPAVVLRNIAERLVGLELDPFAAWMSQVFVEVALADVARAARRRLPRLVSVGDSLTRAPEPRFDLVIGNPPYGRVGLKPTLRATYARGLYGHANLYGLFTDLALRYASERGVISYVTPTSFLGGQYFRRLRELLLAEAPPLAIDFIAPRRGVFDDVLQETLLATYARRRPPGRVSVAVVEPSEAAARVTDLGQFAVPASGGAPWILPRSSDQTDLVSALGRLHHRLRDWGYKVSTGPLVWNRFKPQLRQKAGAGCVPLLWAEAVTSQGTFLFRAEKKNHAPYFRPRAGDEWLLVERPCVLVQRTTAKEQHRRLIAAELPAAFLREHRQVTIENHLNMVLPREDAAPAVPPRLLAAFLNTRAVDRAFRCISGSVAVSAFELSALPLPAPAKVAALASLLADRDAFEEACSTLYRCS